VARLRDDSTGEVCPLPARALVGRAATCFVRREAVAVSKEHALVQWSGGGWTVRDLGSRNGTYLDGKRLEVGATAPLPVGSRLGFGAPDVTSTLLDDAAPGPLAFELRTRAVREPAGGMLTLPEAEAPEAVVFQAEDGGWVVERGDETEPVEDQAVLSLGEQAWCLFLPGQVDVTPLVQVEKTLAGVTFRFEVSRDEEHVSITLLKGEAETRLEPREHAYVLLTLARLRARDAALPRAERGWVDKAELQRMLRMRANALNVAVHRARQQLAEAGVVGAAGVVEVRRGKRRFGSDRFEEIPLEE